MYSSDLFLWPKSWSVLFGSKLVTCPLWNWGWGQCNSTRGQRKKRMVPKGNWASLCQKRDTEEKKNTNSLPEGCP